MTIVRGWRIAFVALALFITWQTLTPDADDTESGMAIARMIAELLFRSAEMGDKVAHFMAYAALGASAAFGQVRLIGRRAPIVAGIAAYGMALEGLQGLGGVRAPELADAAANALGVISRNTEIGKQDLEFLHRVGPDFGVLVAETVEVEAGLQGRQRQHDLATRQRQAERLRSAVAGLIRRQTARGDKVCRRSEGDGFSGPRRPERIRAPYTEFLQLRLRGNHACH
mgnify:CR=1 FL=1